MQDIELISFDLCPFVQRSIITLLEKDLPFKRTNIDLSAKPQWLMEISPLGKVPILRINGEILFESAVINEYLDDISPPSLHPADPLIKAKNRAWIEYASDLLTTSFKILTSNEEKKMIENLDRLTIRLEFLENNFTGLPYFNGNDFLLIDTAYAPLFIRHEYVLKDTLPSDPLKNCPNVKKWAEFLLRRESVRSSIIDDYAGLAIASAKSYDSILFER